MNIVQSVTTCLQKSFTFSGRASRSEYWWFTIFSSIINQIILGFMDNISDNSVKGENIGLLLLLVAVILLLASASISVTVRRLHDVNRSGWWWWIACTIIGALFPLFYWYVKSGTNGDNDYGKKPE